MRDRHTLRIAAEKVAFLPPRRVTDDTSILTLKNLVFEPLCRWRDGRAYPGLFARWERHDGGRRWLFHIRDGAVFHDGKACESADVIAFIDGILQSVDTFGMKWSYARYLDGVTIIARSAHVIEVVSPRPFADILDIFTEFYVCREAADGRAILGTGLYRVAELSDGAAVTLEATGESTALHFIAIPDAAARYRALREGRVDVALNTEHADGASRDERFVHVRAINTLSVIYYLNCGSGLFATPDARMAVNLAIDRRRLIDELFHGLGVPAATIVSPFHLGFASAGLSQLPFDPERAQRLLDRLGGTGEITIRTPRTMPEKADRISEFVADSLRRVGLGCRIKVQPDRPEYAREVGRKQIGDMAIFDSSPHSTFRVLNDKISSRVKAVWWQGYDDPAVEGLIEQANRAVEDDERETAYGRCLTRLQANPPWLYLFHPIVEYSCAPGIGGFLLDHKGVLGVAP